MTKPYPTEAARLIDRWCREQGVSQAELSRRVGRSHSWLSGVVNGRNRNPDFADLRRVAEVTGLAFEALVADRDRSARQMVRRGLDMATVRDRVASGAVPPDGRPLSAAWRREILRYIDRLPAWLDKPLDRIPADPRWLRPALARLHPRALGVSRRVWQKAKSAYATALAIAGVTPIGGRPIWAVDPAWRRLYEAVRRYDAEQRPSRSYYAIRLSRFIRYCHAHGIAPDAVDAAAFEGYAAFADSFSLAATDLSRRLREARSAWNHCARHVPGWPPIVLAAPGRDTLRLPLETFPDSLRAELERYRRTGGVADAERFDPALVGYSAAMQARAERRATLLALARAAGKRATRVKPWQPLAAATAEQHVDVLRLTASVLVRGGRDAASLRGIADLATPEAAVALLDDLDRRGAPPNRATRASLVGILHNVAARWCPTFDERRAIEFTALRDMVDNRRREMRPEERRTVDHFLIDETAMARLIALPIDIWAELEAERARRGGVTERMALRMESAALLAILLSLPVRRTTLARTRRDNVTWSSQGRALVYWPAADVKQRKPLRAELGRWKATVLRTYLDKYRPTLVREPENQWVFPGRQPRNRLGHREPAKLAANLKRVVEESCGHRIPTHLWRKLMGGYLFRQLKNPGVARALLGHSKGSSVTSLYIDSLETLAASEILDRLMAKRLAEAGHRPVDLGSAA